MSLAFDKYGSSSWVAFQTVFNETILLLSFIATKFCKDGYL